MHQRQRWVSLDRRCLRIWKLNGVHSCFSFGGNETRSKPIFRPTVFAEIASNATAISIWCIINIRGRRKIEIESTTVQIGIRSSAEANGNSSAQRSSETYRSIERECCLLFNSSAIAIRAARLCKWFTHLWTVIRERLVAHLDMWIGIQSLSA